MPARLNALYGMSLVAAGCSVAAWTLVHPWGTIAGPEVGSSTGWAVSHTFHFLGGFFGSIGLLGLVHRQGAASTLERVGYFVAFAGTVMFTGTGIVTAFVWPVLASNAPSLVELTGPFFSPPHPIIGVTALAFSAGYIMLAIALARSDVISKGVAAVAIVGALLLVPPPPPLSPMPWVAFPMGGLFLGVGIVAIGLAVRSGRAGPPVPAAG